MAKKEREPPDFNYILNELTEEQPLKTILIGHLVVEALLVDVANIKIDKNEFDVFKLNFPRKVDLCISLGLFDNNKRQSYLKLNEIRNHFAHELNYKFTFEDTIKYIKDIGKAGFLLSVDINKGEKCKIEDLLIEVLNILTLELQGILYDNGKDYYL
jgi:hypothetical protein